jgi:rubrerythrin
MTLNDTLTLAFFERLVSTPEGRAHVLATCADAESTDEGRVFEHLLDQVDDPELKRLVKRHQEDELRHAELFRNCLARTGVKPPVVPDHLKLLGRVDALTGNVMHEPITSRAGVMRAYLVLQVLEERATTQFPIHIRAYDRVDPESARVVRGILADEERHLKYCRAISRRYAPDEATLRDELARLRHAEARAFADNSRANMDYVRDRGLVTFGALEGVFWGALQAITGTVRREVRTPYWSELPAAA